MFSFPIFGFILSSCFCRSFLLCSCARSAPTLCPPTCPYHLAHPPHWLSTPLTDPNSYCCFLLQQLLMSFACSTVVTGEANPRLLRR